MNHPLFAPGDAGLREHRLSSQPVLSGHFLQVFRDTVRLPDGSTAVREYIHHPGAVMIVPLLDLPGQPLQVVVERQFRYPLGQVLIEFPAGKLDPHESTQACAERELLEETGYVAREWARAGLLHPCLSYADEFIDIWFARGLSPGRQKLDHGEFIEVFAATPAELMQACAQGRLTDAKTLVGLLWLQQALAGLWPLQWQAPAAAPPPAEASR